MTNNTVERHNCLSTRPMGAGQRACLGVVFYDALTSHVKKGRPKNGQSPFGDTTSSVVATHVHVSPRTVRKRSKIKHLQSENFIATEKDPLGILGKLTTKQLQLFRTNRLVYEGKTMTLERELLAIVITVYPSDNPGWSMLSALWSPSFVQEYTAKPIPSSEVPSVLSNITSRAKGLPPMEWSALEGNTVSSFELRKPKKSLYVIGCEGGGPVKIGRAFSPCGRVAELQNGSPVKLSVLLELQGLGWVEKHIHKSLSDRCSHGEWYNVTPQEVKQAAHELDKTRQGGL